MENKTKSFIAEVARELDTLPLDNWDIYLTESEEREISVRQQEVEDVKQTQETGYSIRLLKDQKLSLVYGNKLNVEDAKRLIDKAQFIQSYMTVDEAFRMNKTVSPAGNESVLDDSFDSIPVETKARYIFELEKQIFSQHPSIKLVEHLGYSEAKDYLVYKTKFSEAMEQRSVYYGFGGDVIAEEGTEAESGSYYDYKTRFSMIDRARLAKEIAYHAYSMLKAQPLASGRYSVIMKNEVFASFLGTFFDLFSADKVQNNRSVLAGQRQKKMASSLLTLTDDALLPDELASHRFDGEGTTAQRTVLIQEGILLDYLYDLKTASKENRASTGNALRGSFRGSPMIGPTNMVVKPGTHSLDMLMKASETVILLTNVMGMHTANTVNGEFSVGASGYLVRGGEIVSPVKQFTIAGNFLKLLETIEQVGGDTENFPMHGNIICPSVFISDLSISGQ